MKIKGNVAVLLILTCLFQNIQFVETSEETYDPCCSYPCQNFGVCNRIGFSKNYYCDCYGTGYYGKNCETVKGTHPPWPEPHNTAAPYPTWDGYSNKSYWSLTLPPVPKNCPTPMGIRGPKKLPNPKELVEKVFTRTKFMPCPRGTSVLLALYGQHFNHQRFKSYTYNKLLTWGQQSVDLSHIYGESLHKQRILRSNKGGKMKMQIINGEEYPPNVKDCPGIDMPYPPSTPQQNRFALGHPFFALLPTLLYWSTLWLREHNRVCDIMAKEHPDWDDERLFQTARLIVLGETLKVTVNSYIQHVSGIHFQLTYEPGLLHNWPQRWASSRVHLEFNTLYHWHNTMPDYFFIAGKNYSLDDIRFDPSPLVDHGMAAFTYGLSNQVAGRGAGGRNMAKKLHPIAVETIKMNRKARLQPFNRYREYFRLPKIKTFEELTGETRLARILSDFYGGDIDAVEFFVGIMVEKRYKYKMWGITLTEAFSSYALRSIFSNVVASPEYWRESTFGGKVGFDIVKKANFDNLICRNIHGCPKAKFQIQEAITERDDPGMVYNDLPEVMQSTDDEEDTTDEL